MVPLGLLFSGILLRRYDIQENALARSGGGCNAIVIGFNLEKTVPIRYGLSLFMKMPTHPTQIFLSL